MNILIDGQTLETPEVNRGIGIYFKNTLNNMVKMSFCHNWYIAVSSADSIKYLDPWVQKRLHIIEDNAFSPCSDFSRTDTFTSAVENAVSRYGIDLYWCPNPLMVNVLYVDRILPCRMVTFLHDIIPAIMPVKEWSSEVKKEYARRLEFLSSEKIMLLCNSDASKNDFIKYVAPRGNIYTTLLAADSRKFYIPKTASGDPENPIIVFTGGFDYRKNTDGAVRALALACHKFPGDKMLSNARMYIVCKAPKNQQDEFYSFVDEQGLGGRVKLTGFISDEDLSSLYNSCDVFFFPSLYEGFGLPIVEAMLGGAYVLSADNSSLPEVCGGHALLCNAKDTEDMAVKLRQALSESFAESLEQKQERQRYALTFSWERTALQTLAYFEGEAPVVPEKKQKIAIVTPWPEQNTGIANFEYKLIPYLQRYFDIDIFVDDTFVSDCRFLPYSGGNKYSISEFDRLHGEYDHILYQVGNSSDFHTGIYKAMLKYKGIAEIHDYVLHPFFYHSFFLKKDYSVYKQALINGYGEEGLAHYKDVYDKVGCPDNEKFPMAESVAAVSSAVIFHNHWSKEQMQRDNVYVIPHPSFDKNIVDEEEKAQYLDKLKKMIGYRGEYVIGCFGFVNGNKRPIVAAQAVAELNRSGYRAKLVFFGKCNCDELIRYISENSLQDNVTITGYLEKNEYETYLDFCDLIINLRYPSMGEASGTLCEAFKYGKPVIVSEVNQYCEYPDEVCWKIPVGGIENECLVDMLKYLIDHEDVRKALGENARNYADTVLSPAKIAQEYYKILSAIE